MIRCLKGNLYRLFRSKSFYGLLVVVIIIALYGCYESRFGITGYGSEVIDMQYKIDSYKGALNPIPLVCVLVSAIFTYIFSVGRNHKAAVKNKVVSGTRRLSLYASDLITSLVVSVIYCVTGLATCVIFAAVDGVKVIPDATTYLIAGVLLLFFVPLVTLIVGASYNNQLLTVLFAVVLVALCYSLYTSITDKKREIDHEYMYEEYKTTEYLDYLGGYIQYTDYRLVKNPNFSNSPEHDRYALMIKLNPISIVNVFDGVEDESSSDEVENKTCNPNACPKLDINDYLKLGITWSIVFIVSGLVIYKKMEIK